ncbi:hypothetical protein E2C01_087520 [Portunus trituberculatus]|uniref:Uncharacterized protein n=1 Tax=Portunus trituberculatus TaxID=210409 RepID=A0A5B7J3K2_PORTR|nr:hypothetical protein [Portunus trituberculatus]
MPATVPQWAARHLLAAAAPTSRRGRAEGVPRGISKATVFPADLLRSLWGAPNGGNSPRHGATRLPRPISSCIRPIYLPFTLAPEIIELGM